MIEEALRALETELGPIAYAYLPAEHTEPGTEVAVETFGEWVGGDVASEPLFDPQGDPVRL